MMNYFSYLIFAATLSSQFDTQATESERIVEVAERGADVMPFDIKATSDIFTRTDTGGEQSVVSKNSSDLVQVDLVRKHLREIQAQIAKGNFSGPTHVHGQDMPGLAQL